MARGFTTEQQTQIEKAAVLNQFTYLDAYQADKDGTPNYWNNRSLADLSENESQLNTPVNSENPNDPIKVFQEVMDANPAADGMTLISHSVIDTGIPDTQLIATAFRDANGDIYISYRGTGDGKWIDNGEGMSKEQTIMQQKALEYFDHIMETHPTDGQVIVTGHSKGGNLAQYATMKSKYGDRVDACYSMNGQGFSDKAIESFKSDLGEEGYNERINKMYSINGNNDYVHDLGNPIIPEENTYFLPTTTGDDPEKWHHLEGFFSNGSFNWPRNDDGSINWNYPQGPVGTFAKSLSERMMKLDDELLYDCGVTIMSVLELIMTNGMWDENLIYGTGERIFATKEEIMSTLPMLLPLVTLSAFDTLDDIIENTIRNFINETLASEYGAAKLVIAAVALTVVAAFALPTILKILTAAAVVKLMAYVGVFIGLVKDALIDILNAARKISIKIANFISDLIEIVVSKLRDIADFVISNIMNAIDAGVQFFKDGLDNLIDAFTNPAIIQITPETIYSQANTVRQYRREHEACVNKLRRIVYTLNESWKGEAQTAFVQKFQSMEAVYSSFGEVLGQYADLMTKAGTDIAVADTNLCSMIKTI